MKLVVAATVATLAAAAAPVGAQPGNFAASPPPAPAADQLSEDAAIGLSLGGTAVSWGLMFAAAYADNMELTLAGAVGTMIAPSFGQWYAHQGLTPGLGIRAAGLGIFGLGLSMTIDDLSDDTQLGGLLLLVGLGTYVIGTVDDIATAGSAARKYNRRAEGISVIPTANVRGGGLALVGRF